VIRYIMSQDIRNYMSPVRTPNRSRRIETDDDEPLVPPGQSAADRTPVSSQVPPGQSAADQTPVPSQVVEGSRSNPVECDSNPQSTDDEDNEIEEPGLSVVMRSSKPSSTKQPLHPASSSAAVPVNTTVASQQRRVTPKKDSNQTSNQRSKSGSKMQSPRSQESLKKSRKRERIVAEASESDALTDNRSCEESDGNAKGMFASASDLYRSSILGVRNKTSALKDLRDGTSMCPVCARFAEFLKFFPR
jgi:hypothetical protein